jgi:FkbM family methyltransferase
VTYQHLLLRLCALPGLRRAGRFCLGRLTWTVEQGPGAGLKIHFPQNRDYIAGSSEPPVQREIAQRLAPGDVFYDVGANMGFFALIAGRLVGPQGHVCAFEPHPGNARAVRENARLNSMSHLRVFEIAAGSEARQEELRMTDWDGGAALSRYPVGPSSSVTRTEVQVVALDDFIADQGLPAPTFVKIDVEGAELEVIEGMRRTIERCKPVLLYEMDDANETEFKRRWGELDAAITALGYEIHRLETAYPHIDWHVGHSLALPDTGPVAA